MKQDKSSSKKVKKLRKRREEQDITENNKIYRIV